MLNLDFIPFGAHVHFVGIGGISMSALASILLDNGYTVSGSDSTESHITRALAGRGATLHYAHEASNANGADLLVFTSAVKSDNAELVFARAHNIPVMERATLLGALMRGYKNPVAVAGTHGKTTTTAMLSTILLDAALDPTILVGGELATLGTNIVVGKSEYFVTEACEYVENFLKFYPKYSVILNIEEDHLDYFRDLDHIKSAFAKFAALTPPDGVVIANVDDAEACAVALACGRNVATYSLYKGADFDLFASGTAADAVQHGRIANLPHSGTADAMARSGDGCASSHKGTPADSTECGCTAVHFFAGNLTLMPNGCYQYDFCVSQNGAAIQSSDCTNKSGDAIQSSDCANKNGAVIQPSSASHVVRLQVPGAHNASNSLAAAAVAHLLGVDTATICKSLSNFNSVHRRYETKGTVGGVTVVDDYAHHPTEITATLTTAKSATEGKVWCVFQPHTYTRTRALLCEFAEALALADNVIVTDIYAAREPDDGTIHSRDLAAKIDGAVYIKDFADIAAYVCEKAKPGDLVITMGAGDVEKLGEALLLCKN